MKTGGNPVEQIAALPIIRDKSGSLRVLMVTSRETKRWVMPKGWTMDGKKPWAAAEIEALEEAGAVGRISKRPIGTYYYRKILSEDAWVPCRVTLYPMMVERLKKRWKERRERRRHWFSPAKAARLVDEPELKEILTGLAEEQKKQPVIKRLLKAS